MGARLPRLMRPRELAVLGAWLVLAMNVVFLAGGLDRGALYALIQTVGIVAGMLLLRGVRRDEAGLMAAGLGVLAFSRVAHIALSLSRLPVWLNLGQGVLYALAAVVAVQAPQRRNALLPASLWLLAGSLFVASILAVTGGRIAGILGLLCGTLGFSLIAPNLHHADEAVDDALPG